MAPRRWNPVTRQLIVDALEGRDGPGCHACHAEPSAPLEIDHIDNNPKNTTWGNLQLLCRTCNLAKRPRADRGTFVSVRERQPQLPLSATDQAKTDLPYDQGSPEMRANTYYERSYRAWLLTQLPIAKQEAIASGAETVGCSTETAARYLMKLCSKAGPIQTHQDIHGAITLQRKPQTEEKVTP